MGLRYAFYAQASEFSTIDYLWEILSTDLIVGVPLGDEPPPGSSLSVAGQPGAIYSAGALQLVTKRAVWSENHPHNLAPSVGKKEE